MFFFVTWFSGFLFVNLLTQLTNLKFFFTFLSMAAIGFLLVSSDFKLWQQKLTLACVLHLSHGAKVLRFFTTPRQTVKYYFLLRSVCTGYDISVLFQMPCY